VTCSAYVRSCHVHAVTCAVVALYLQQLLELIVTAVASHSAICMAAPGRVIGNEFKRCVVLSHALRALQAPPLRTARQCRCAVGCCRFDPSLDPSTWIPGLEVCVPSKLYVHMSEMEVFFELRDVLLAVTNGCRPPDRWMTRAAIRAFGLRDTGDVRHVTL
jgi:hypothetical protein